MEVPLQGGACLAALGVPTLCMVLYKSRASLRMNRMVPTSMAWGLVHAHLANGAHRWRDDGRGDVYDASGSLDMVGVAQSAHAAAVLVPSVRCARV